MLCFELEHVCDHADLSSSPGLHAENIDVDNLGPPDLFWTLSSDIGINIPVESFKVMSKVVVQVLHKEAPTLHEWRSELFLNYGEVKRS
jgi:hypothetical protein